ncbi:MAG: creatininase family protein, partial [Burkholderiales bacterium]|nr:creatininase family protein [Burkholderiales bacterium]
ISDIVAGIVRHKVKRVFLLNTGISTIAALSELARQHTHLVLLNAYAGPRCAAAREEVLESGGGGHADEKETSLLLAIAPEQVAMERAPGQDQANMKAAGPLQWRDPK